MKTTFRTSLYLAVFIFAGLIGITGTVEAAKGTLRCGVDTPARKWNPHLNTAALQVYFLSPVYEGLVGEDPEGKIVPLLATKWEQTAKSITFTLREGVYFHDGTKFDANAVKANIEDVKLGKNPANAKKLDAIESVEIIDSTHVRFKLSRPAPNLLINLQRFAGLMASPAALKSNSIEKQPVGTGPWKLDLKRTVSDSKYVYSLNENYWNPSVQGVKEIEIHILPYEQQFNAIITKKLDVAELHSGFVNQARAGGIKIIAPEGPHQGLHIFDRTGKLVPEFADQRVRRALSHAIDRKAFFKVVFAGFGTGCTQQYLPGHQWYDGSIEDLSYNPEKAKKLLAEAGVKNLSFDVFSQGRFFDDMYEPIAGMFKKIGVTMNVKRIARGQLFVAGASGDWAAGILPIIDRHPLDFYNNRIAPDGFLNPFKYSDNEINSLVEKAMTLDGKSVDPLWARMCRLVAEKGYIIHIGAMRFAIMVNKRAKNVRGMTFAPSTIYFRGVTVD